MNFIFASQKYENKFGFQDSTFSLYLFIFLGQTNSPLKPQKNKKDAASIRARGLDFK